MSFLFLRLKTKIFFWTSSSSSFFFFFPEFKLGFKKKGGQVHDEGVQICITGGFKTNFFSILYIYIYINSGQGVHLNPLTISYHRPIQ